MYYVGRIYVHAMRLDYLRSMVGDMYSFFTPTGLCWDGELSYWAIGVHLELGYLYVDGCLRMISARRKSFSSKPLLDMVVLTERHQSFHTPRYLPKAIDPRHRHCVCMSCGRSECHS